MKMITTGNLLLLLAAGLLVVSPAYAADGHAAVETQTEPMQSDDARALESLCSYVVGETTFGTFQDDFTGYFTRSTTRNPNSGPGTLLKPLKWSKQVNAPMDKSDLLLQMMGKERVPEELTPYVTGAYLLGHPKPESTVQLYDRDPDSFNALAVLQFKEGVLSMLEVTLCDD